MWRESIMKYQIGDKVKIEKFNYLYGGEEVTIAGYVERHTSKRKLYIVAENSLTWKEEDLIEI